MAGFEHLKNKRNDNSIEEFIEGANKDPKAKESKKKSTKQDYLLIVTGKADKDNYVRPTVISLKRDIQTDLDKYCSGSKQGIINTLLRFALDEIIRNGKIVIEEIE